MNFYDMAAAARWVCVFLGKCIIGVGQCIMGVALLAYTVVAIPLMLVMMVGVPLGMLVAFIWLVKTIWLAV